MGISLLRTDEEIKGVYLRHVDMVYRICFLFLKNEADAEDMVQNTFLKFIGHDAAFKNAEHEKAWLIVTASNLCKDFLCHWWRRRTDIESLPVQAEPAEIVVDETLQKVLNLPEKYKTAVYLHYYEGYKCKEIAVMLAKKESTIRTYLKKGRDLLRLELDGDEQ